MMFAAKLPSQRERLSRFDWVIDLRRMDRETRSTHVSDILEREPHAFVKRLNAGESLRWMVWHEALYLLKDGDAVEGSLLLGVQAEANPNVKVR